MAVVINDFEVSEQPQPESRNGSGGGGDNKSSGAESPLKTMKEVEKTLRRQYERGRRLVAH